MSAKEVLFSQDLILGILAHLIPASDPDSQLDRGPYEYFKEVDHRDLCRRTLASVARVCRDLQEPALDALWSVIDGIGPLLLILPSVSKSEGDYVSQILLLISLLYSLFTFGRVLMGRSRARTGLASEYTQREFGRLH